jgi:putative oxidoreductase
MNTRSAAGLFTRSYELLTRVTGSLRSPLLLAIRLYWGWQLAQSGWGKLHNLGNVTAFFTTLGLPAPHVTALAISNPELFGGILLALGLGSRLIGLVLTGNMMMAYITADREALRAVFSDPAKFYNADPFTFLMASVLVMILGAGFFSVDRLLQWFQQAHKTEHPMHNAAVQVTAA